VIGGRTLEEFAVIASLGPPSSDPPAELVEGWAKANMGEDPVEQARDLKEGWERGNGFTLRELTGAHWYLRHQNPVYADGAPLVDSLLRRFGPEKFLEFYTTCQPAAFDAIDPRRSGTGPGRRS
jgi:hypothetical protein